MERKTDGAAERRFASAPRQALPGGRFQRKTSIDADERPAEVRAAVARAKAGDQDALRYLYVRFSGNVYGYALGIVKNEHEAEDVAQQVFTRVMTAIGGYEERTAPFSSWLLRITHNLAVDHLRRRRTVPHEDHHVAPAKEEDRGREIAAALKQALADLPEQQRTVVILRHIAGLSPGEIAAEIGGSEDSIHGLHHRARRRLRKALTEMEVTPSAVDLGLGDDPPQVSAATAV